MTIELKHIRAQPGHKADDIRFTAQLFVDRTYCGLIWTEEPGGYDCLSFSGDQNTFTRADEWFRGSDNPIDLCGILVPPCLSASLFKLALEHFEWRDPITDTQFEEWSLELSSMISELRGAMRTLNRADTPAEINFHAITRVTDRGRKLSNEIAPLL